MKHTETDLFKKPSFRCRRENRRARGKPTEASLDWKPNPHKNPGLIGAERGKIRYANVPASPIPTISSLIILL